jgi:hypothetical protein
MRTGIISIVTAAGLVIGGSAAVLAQGSSQNAPGQQMQNNGSVPGQPGASGYAPGQQMQDKGSKAGQPGASGYAPGQQSKTPDTSGTTTGQGAGSNSHSR